MSSPGLVHYLRKPLQSTWVCHLRRSSWSSLGNSFQTPTYPWPMRNTAPPLNSLGPRTNQLLGLGRNVSSIIVAMLTDHCGMGRHAERMQLPSNHFCIVSSGRSAEEEETFIHFICQCSPHARCRYRLFGSPIFISLTELSLMSRTQLRLSSFRSCFLA